MKLWRFLIERFSQKMTKVHLRETGVFDPKLFSVRRIIGLFYLFILLPEHNGSMRYVIVPIPNGMLTVSPYNTISGSNIRLSFRGGNS